MTSEAGAADLWDESIDPQRLPSAAALIRLRRSSDLVAGPLLYQPPASPNRRRVVSRAAEESFFTAQSRRPGQTSSRPRSGGPKSGSTAVTWAKVRTTLAAETPRRAWLSRPDSARR